MCLQLLQKILKIPDMKIIGIKGIDMERSRMMKKLVGLCLALGIVLSGMYILGQSAEAANDVVWDDTNYAIKDYWSEEEKKVPVKKDYIFAGWYDENKKALSMNELSGEKVKDIKAYAKFVPSEVLSVKTQISEIYTKEGETTERRSIRLLSTVDCTDYTEVGFKYILGNGAEKTMQMTEVYSKLKKSKQSNETIEPEIFSQSSKYFLAMDINNISEKNWQAIAYARPYWITADGTTVMGLARNNRVEDNDATGNEYVSVSVNLMSDGNAIDGQPAGIAAGKIIVDYSQLGLDIAKDTNDNYLIDNSDIFPMDEMKCYVNTTNKTITFVGNGDDVNKVTIADGLFANIRFMLPSASETYNLDGITLTSEFCNWNEDKFTDEVVVQ